MNTARSCLLVLVLLAGCGKPAEWVISAENKGAAPCGLSLVTRGGSTASVDKLEPGRSHELISSKNATVLETIKVTRGKDVETVSPDFRLEPGRRYRIIIHADQQIEVSEAP